MSHTFSRRYQEALDFAQIQVAATIERNPDYFPVYTRGGRWRHEGEAWTDWTGGFLAGMMWKFAQLTGDAAWRNRAEHYSRLLEHRKCDRNVHDLGFIFLGAYLPWYEMTGEERYRDVLVQAAETFAKRFQEKGGYLSSFLGPQSLFIDIMMNVPLLFYAANQNGDRRLYEIAKTHCRTTRNALVRPDGSTAHEGIFEPLDGRFQGQSTQQGLSAESTWSRGLAWSMYGFSKVFALTGEAEFLAVAEWNADYWLTHLPIDKVPYWDFDLPGIVPRPSLGQKDSSAAAIAASALLDLERQTASLERAVVYRQTALAMLDALVDDDYLADQTPEWEGVLKHGVYHVNKNLGVNESVIWGDFFVVEALLKLAPSGQAPSVRTTTSILAAGS